MHLGRNAHDRCLDLPNLPVDDPERFEDEKAERSVGGPSGGKSLLGPGT
jgi:hypothetical protein